MLAVLEPFGTDPALEIELTREFELDVTAGERRELVVVVSDRALELRLAVRRFLTAYPRLERPLRAKRWRWARVEGASEFGELYGVGGLGFRNARRRFLVPVSGRALYGASASLAPLAVAPRAAPARGRGSRPPRLPFFCGGWMASVPRPK